MDGIEDTASRDTDRSYDLSLESTSNSFTNGVSPFFWEGDFLDFDFGLLEIAGFAFAGLSPLLITLEEVLGFT